MCARKKTSNRATLVGVVKRRNSPILLLLLLYNTAERAKRGAKVCGPPPCEYNKVFNVYMNFLLSDRVYKRCTVAFVTTDIYR